MDLTDANILAFISVKTEDGFYYILIAEGQNLKS